MNPSSSSGAPSEPQEGRARADFIVEAAAQGVVFDQLDLCYRTDDGVDRSKAGFWGYLSREQELKLIELYIELQCLKKSQIILTYLFYIGTQSYPCRFLEKKLNQVSYL